MSVLGRFFRKIKKRRTAKVREPEQAVIVYLNGTDLPDNVYEKYDLFTLEEKLTESIERDSLGEFDGHEMRPTETVLFMYGPDAERLFAGIEHILRQYPLCMGAHAVIRRGGPGSKERIVKL